MKKYPYTLAAIALSLIMSRNILADEQVTEIHIKIQKGRFIPSEIPIAADTKVQLVIENLDDTPEEFESYDLNREVLINPLSKAAFYIGPLSPGNYQFEGEFSPQTAQGVVRVK